MATTLRTPSRTTTSCLSTMRWTTWTPSRTWTCTTRSTEHTARRPLMHNGVTSHLWLKSALHASSHPCMCTCVLRLGCFLLDCLVLYFVPPFSFQPFLMFTSALNERSRSNPLCDFRLVTVVTFDHETPLTSRVENWFWDIREIVATWYNFLEHDTKSSTWFLSWGNSSRRNRAIRCEWGNTSWQIGATWCWSSKRSKATTIYHWKRWNRIRIVSGIKIIRESGEWSGAKKTEKFQLFQKIEKLSMVWRMFMVVTMESSVFMGKN